MPLEQRIEVGDEGFEREAMRTLRRAWEKVEGPGASEEATGEFGKASEVRHDCKPLSSAGKRDML